MELLQAARKNRIVLDCNPRGWPGAACDAGERTGRRVDRAGAHGMAQKPGSHHSSSPSNVAAAGEGLVDCSLRRHLSDHDWRQLYAGLGIKPGLAGERLSCDSRVEGPSYLDRRQQLRECEPPARTYTHARLFRSRNPAVGVAVFASRNQDGDAGEGV